MSRYAAFLLFLAIIPWSLCAPDSDYPDDYEPTEAPFIDTTTTTVKTTTTTTTMTTTTADPTTPTTKPTQAPTTTKPTQAPTTTKPTPAPTTTKPTVAPTTTKPTVAPTTKPTTAAPPTTEGTNTTTPTAPNTTVTSTTPTPTTTPAPMPDPTSTTYEVKNDNDTCLMVKLGLQIGYRGDKYEKMNVNPNTTTFTGVCAEDNSTLVLHADNLTLSFTFHNDSKKFSLVALSVTGNLTSGTPVSEVNTSLSLWQASLGSSYMCNKQQSSNITAKLTISTVDLRVQPFGIKKNTFSTAQECSLDDTSILIPIVVGAALAGLILIVVIAYVIGRRKTYVGYQTL